MFAPFPQTTHHLAVVFSTFTEIPGKQVVTDMLQQCVEVIWLICKRSNWCPTESQVGPIFWLFLAFRASKMRTLTNPGFGIKTKWRRGAAHNGGGATTHAPCAQKTRFFNCTKLSWLYDALTKRTWTNFGYKKGICHKINLKNGLLRMYFDLSRTVYLAASTLCCSAVSINERAMRTNFGYKKGITLWKGDQPTNKVVCGCPSFLCMWRHLPGEAAKRVIHPWTSTCRPASSEQTSCAAPYNTLRINTTQQSAKERSETLSQTKPQENSIFPRYVYSMYM